MDFVVFLVALIVWGVIWVSLYRIYRQRSWGWVSSQLMSGTMGTAAAFFVVVLALGTGLIEARQAGDTGDVPTPSVVAGVAAGAPTEPEPEPEPEQEQEPETAPTPAATKTFNFNDERYLKRLEQVLKTLNHKQPFEARPIKRGVINDTRTIMLSSVVAITLGLDKHSGYVNAITVIGMGDGTVMSGAEIFIQASAALGAAIPGASAFEMAKPLSSLLEGKSVQLGNIRLSARKMDELGTWFFAEPV